MILPLHLKRSALSLLLLIPCYLFAANPNIKNYGFENGFTGWTGKIWTYYTSNGGVSTTPSAVALPYDPRIVIMSDQSAYDNCTGNQLKIIPSGYKYSARLGSYNPTTSPARGWDQSLEYTLKIDTTNELLVIKFAVVFELPPHNPDQQPRFVISLLDNSDNLITNLCSSFDENASTLDNTQKSTAPNGQPVVWRDWKTVSANLKAFENQSIKVKFTSYDCTPGGHFGYAYIVMDAQPLYITTKFCGGDSDATLTAPDGFSTYTWKYQGNIISTANQCKVPNAKEGDIYTCVFMTAGQCYDSLSTTIKRIEPIADFTFSTIDCSSTTNTVKFSSNSVADALHPSDTSASLAYQWDFGNGGTSMAADTAYTFSTSGWQKVNLKITSYPSTCTASKDTLVETFYPPFIGIKGDTTYCPGLTTTLKGYGADHYRWIQLDGTQTGTQDSVAVGSPGGQVGLIGYASKDICNTTKYINISEEPAWTLNISGNHYFCAGDSTTLVASGDGISYIWNPQKLQNTSATINKAGNYDVTATNKRGCNQTQSIYVRQIPLPATSFSIEPATINTKFNQVACSIAQEDSIVYAWNMGDGTTETGATFTHSYTGSSDTGKYDIVLNATNSYFGCTDSATQSVVIEPFVPNVFTPNGDSHNDYFMPKYEVEILVYTGTKDSNGWDGSFKGQQADPDTYFYILHYIDYQNQQKTVKGFVTLIR